jgi:hypothetical protein
MDPLCLLNLFAPTLSSAHLDLINTKSWDRLLHTYPPTFANGPYFHLPPLAGPKEK